MKSEMQEKGEKQVYQYGVYILNNLAWAKHFVISKEISG